MTPSCDSDVRFAADTAPASVTTPALAEGETTTDITQSTLSALSSVPASVQGGTEAVEATQPTLQQSQRTRTPSQWVQDLTTGKGTARGCGTQRLPTSIVNHANIASNDHGITNDEEAADAPVYSLAAMAGDEPTYREAMSGPERGDWEAAMREELACIEAMDTYELVGRPVDTNIVGSTWVLKKKCNEHNHVAKFKARLCAQGFSQVYGVDYVETATPTTALSSIRHVLALAAAHNWEVHQIDFKNAYLNGKLDETVYMRQPPGSKATGKEDWVWRLLKALYGLKQSARQWYEEVCALMAKLGLVRSKFDVGVFFLFKANRVIIITVHVDNSILITNSDNVMSTLKTELAARFEIADLGKLRWVLGFEVQCDRTARTISLSQAAYIDTLLACFGMTDAYTLTIPLDPHVDLFRIETPEHDQRAMSGKPYAHLIGSLMYAAIGTRPDIAFTVSTLAHFMANPAPAHWEAAKRVLRYLKGTQDLCLSFGHSADGLVGYSDADWASQRHRHSISSYTFLYNGGVISWSSRKQPIVALSSTEAEYISVSNSSRELLRLRSLLAELTSPLTLPTPLLSDNQSAITIAKSGMLNARTKHIDIRYHFIRDGIASGHVVLEYCPTGKMVADILTKLLVRHKVEVLARLLGLRTA